MDRGDIFLIADILPGSWEEDNRGNRDGSLTPIQNDAVHARL